MKKESFILVSLKGDESKKLAQSISNETCRKILNYLAETEKATESHVAESLKIPISTVHYNLQLLLENKLVEAGEFHYSKKGREILHYSLANKMIIIAPGASEKFLDKLRSIIPVAILIAVIGGLMKFFTQSASKITELSVTTPQAMMAQVASDSSDSVAEASRMMMDSAESEIQAKVFETAADTAASLASSVPNDKIVNETVTQIVSETIKVPFFNHSAAWWFLIGALVAIVLLLIWWSIRRKK